MALRKTASPVVKLDSLSDVNDLGKPWRFTDEDTGLTVTRSCVWSPPGCHPEQCPYMPVEPFFLQQVN